MGARLYTDRDIAGKAQSICKFVGSILFGVLLAGAFVAFQNAALAESRQKASDKTLAKVRAGILGRDERRVLPRALAPMEDRVGLLLVRRYNNARKRWTTATCTASCVSRHVLLTAAHCVMPSIKSKHEGRIDLSRMVFILRPWAGRYSIKLLPRGKTAEERRALIRTGPGWRKGVVVHSLEDWALIPLHEATPCPAILRVRPVRGDDPRIIKKRHALLVVGFQGDKLRQKDPRLYGSVCHATRDARYARRFRKVEKQFGHKLILHFCDLTKGSSGGPVLAKINKRPVIIGVTSRTYLKLRRKRTPYARKGYVIRKIGGINVAAPATVFYRSLKDMIRKYDGQ